MTAGYVVDGETGSLQCPDHAARPQRRQATRHVLSSLTVTASRMGSV